MKKTHLIMLLTAAFMTMFSAYSLAAINQVYDINFKWYSQFNKIFMEEKRNSLKDSWNFSEYPEQMKFGIISRSSDYNSQDNTFGIDRTDLPEINFSRYIMFYGTLGEVNSLEYRLKFNEIAQKGNVVEIKVNLNSPEDESESNFSKRRHVPSDIVIIDKSEFPAKGRLVFVFKDQNGRKLFETYHYVV